MSDNKKLTKDTYGRYVENKTFDQYWDEFHKIESLSMKESIRQKKERAENIKDQK
jgi:hypothetical protein